MPDPISRSVEARALLTWLALILILASIALGCRGPASGSGGVDFSVDIGSNPTTDRPARIVVSLYDSASAPIRGASVEIEGNMSHAGMVPVIARAVELGEGRYDVENFIFTMSGDWVMEVRATLADGRRVEKSFEVRGVRGHQP